MDRVRRLYIKEFLLLFTGITVCLAVLFSVFSVVEKADELIRASVSPKGFVLFGLLQIPEILSYLLPFSGMLCTIFVISLASRRNEITAIKSSGVNLRTFFVPFLLIGIGLSVVNFLVTEYVTPRALEEANRLTARGGSRFVHSERNLWIRGSDGSVIRIGLYVPDRKESKDISVFYFDRDRPLLRIEAGGGHWKREGKGSELLSLYLRDVTVYDLRNLSPPRTEKERIIRGVISPGVLKREEKIIEEMSVRELIRFEKRLRRAGFRNRKLLVDIYSRITFPVTNLFMIMFALSISIRSRKGRGVLAAAAGLLVSLAYMGLYILSLSLGYAEILPPLLAAAMVPLLALFLGTYFFIRIPL